MHSSPDLFRIPVLFKIEKIEKINIKLHFANELQLHCPFNILRIKYKEGLTLDWEIKTTNKFL